MVKQALILLEPLNSLFDEFIKGQLKIKLENIYNNISNSRLTWIIITDNYNSQKNEFSATSLQIAKLAQQIGFILRNNIQYFHPQFPIQNDQLINITTSILMLAKNKDYYFNKDPIREEPMWKDVEWGNGERKNGKKPYNEKGKDPGNFWVKTSKSDDFTTTLFHPLDPSDIIKRILSCSGQENDEIFIYGRSQLFSKYLDKLLKEKNVKFKELNLDISTHEIHNDALVKIKNFSGSLNFTDKIYYSSSEDMNAIPSNSIQSVVTSPPYWGLRDYGHEKEFGKEKEYEDYLKNVKMVWNEVFRVLKNEGTFWLNINTRMKKGDIVLIPADLIKQCKEIGFKLYNVIYWHKRASVAGLTPSNVVDKYEYILVFYKGDKPNFNSTTFGVKDFDLNFDKEVNVWIMDQLVGSLAKNIDKMVRGRKEIPGHGKLKYPHTALFPNDLVKRVLLMTTQKGDIVLDPFMGTGTTAEVAKKLGRHFVGYEINEEYKPIIDYRLEQVSKKMEQTKLTSYF